MQELATKQQIKLVAEGLALSSEISIDLLQEGKWKPTNHIILKEYLNSLHNAVKCLTELLLEQVTLAEAEKIMKEIEGGKRKWDI